MDKQERLRNKLRIQADKVMRKFKYPRIREISNQEVELALYQYSSCEQSLNEYGEREMEWIHDRMAKLTVEEMAVITKRYWEAKSYAIIGNELGHFHDPKWAHRRIAEVLTKLRAS